MAQAQVPDGRYAVEEDGALKFFRVNTPVQGKWKGYTFVQVQASDDLFPVKDRERRRVILGAIAADVVSAMAAYGREIGRCGRCGRTLTSEWRQRGIGPECVKKF